MFLLPTRIVIFANGQRGDSEEVATEQIPLENTAEFRNSLCNKYLAFRGQVHLVATDTELNGERLLLLQPSPELTPPGLVNNELLVLFEPPTRR